MSETTRSASMFLAVLLLASSCSGDDSTAMTSSTSTNSATAVELETYEGDGFEMLLPTQWTVVTASEMDFEALFEAAGDMVDSEALTQQLITAFEQGGKIFAFDFVGSGPGFVDNINVIELPRAGFTIAGIESIVLQQFEDVLGATDVSTEIRDLPAGEAVVVRYRLPSTANEGISVILLTDTAHWEITLSATDVDPLASSFVTMVESFRESR